MKKMEMIQNKKENRSFFCDVVTRSDEQHGNVIEGVPIVFDKETDFGFCKEVIDSGALNQTDLKEILREFICHRKIKVTFQFKSRIL